MVSRGGIRPYRLRHLLVLLAQWSRLKGVVASWVPAGTSWRVLLAMFLLGALAGAGLTMMAHPHAWCERTPCSSTLHRLPHQLLVASCCRTVRRVGHRARACRPAATGTTCGKGQMLR